MTSFTPHFLPKTPGWLSWERLVMLLTVMVPFVAWHQDELYVWGWTAGAVLLAMRVRSNRVSLQWSWVAIGVVVIAALGHPWNRHALLYVGAALAMTMTGKPAENIGKTAGLDLWVATGLYGLGIWGGWWFEWSTPGFTELHCGTWLLLLLHAVSAHSDTTDWKPWVGIVAHGGTCAAMSAWAPAFGLILLVAWWVWGRHWPIRKARWLVGSCMVGLLILTLSSSFWPLEGLPPSLQERATLWTWTLSEDFGAIHGPGQWRFGIAEADLFEGARQPRRAHNTWLEWGHDLGVLGWAVLLLFVMLHPWLALITSPLFFLWFPTERPDFMLLMALLTSQGMLGVSSAGNWTRFLSAPWPKAIALLFSVVWMLAVAMSMHSIRVQKKIERHARMHWTLPPLSPLNRLTLTFFPDGVRGKSDGWVKLMQHALKEGQPCKAVEWADKRRERGFPDQKSLEAKARERCP